MKKDERRRLFYITLDQVISEIDVRFSNQNTKLYSALFVLQTENSEFFDVKMMQPLGFGRPYKGGSRI